MLNFEIKCERPVKDSIFDLASFEKFLNDRIKVNGKAGVLGDSVVVTREATSIRVEAKSPFSKRYLKVLEWFSGPTRPLPFD
jgi:large subunit ribosomal protein L22e